MGAKNFAREVGLGFLLEIIFTLVLLFLQGVNNATMSPSKSNIEIANDSF